jgi:hypothetical protein
MLYSESMGRQIEVNTSKVIVVTRQIDGLPVSSISVENLNLYLSGCIISGSRAWSFDYAIESVFLFVAYFSSIIYY